MGGELPGGSPLKELPWIHSFPTKKKSSGNGSAMLARNIGRRNLPGGRGGDEGDFFGVVSFVLTLKR